MKSSLEPLEGNKIKLYVEVEEAEFDRDIDRAFKAIAREVKLPGFRNGKAPRRVLEARIGVGPAREQALRDSIPQYLAKAVREHDVDLIATPEIEVTGGQDDGPVEFDATCEVRPEITVPGYGGLRVELPSIEVTDDDIAEAIDTERRRHGAPREVDRPAETGDTLTIDLVTTRDGEELSGLNTEDFSYELGQGWITDDFDDQLTGAKAGEVVTFSSTPKGTDEAADFEVTVKAVSEMELPDVDDEWVSENLGEYDTVDEWRDALREQIGETKLNRARQGFAGEVTKALVELADVEAPEAMVQSDLRSRVQNTVQQLQANGIDLEQWLAATGQDADGFMSMLKGQSEQASKLDLALRAVADAEQIEVTDDDLDAEYQMLAMRVGEKVNRVRKAYVDNDAEPELVAQLRKQKALQWLLRHTEVVDPDGRRIDNDDLLGENDDESLATADDDAIANADDSPSPADSESDSE